MSVVTIIVCDAIGGNISKLPPGRAAGYTTGSGDVPWTAKDFAEHPGAVRICQNAQATDKTADILDVEQGAATLADCARWAVAALANFKSAIRPGQRSPAIYCSRSNVTNVVNALKAGGVKNGIGLWVADWDNNQPAAMREVSEAAGPFPVIARQYRNAGLYDISVFSLPWMVNVSTTVKPPVPPGQWNDPEAWTWNEVVLTGTGLDGKLHAFVFNGQGWTKVK